MTTPTAEALSNPGFRKMLMEALSREEPVGLTVRDLLPRPPKFRKQREISARRRRKLEKRGEYCHFVRWTVNGKCRYLWSGPTPDTYTQRLGPWQNPQWTPPQAETIYRMETRYEIPEEEK